MTRSSSFFELSLRRRIGPKADALDAELFFRACGFRAEEVIKAKTQGSVSAAVYTPSAASAADCRHRFEASRLKGWKFRSKFLGPKDWLTKWESAYQIGPLGRKFTIVPYRLRKRFRGRRIPVYIDPRGAFGSGTHETTRIVVSLMEPLQGRFRTFLDAGTGTGVLLVVAARLGARSLKGIDLHAASVAAARQNLRFNRVKAALRQDDVARAGGTYDLVAANLISEVLIELQNRLALRVAPRGYLLVSGIERRNFKRFLARFRPSGLRRVSAKWGRGWCGAAYRRA